jgi:ribosomal protein S18 acetylase RimI-like enzyme
VKVAEPGLTLTDAPSETDADLLRQGLIADNRPFLGEFDLRRLGVMLQTGSRTVGGLIGETVRGQLHIEMLWLPPEFRRRGLGSRLLRAAETEARARGCRIAWLDTFDFQARPFYERHGYGVLARLGGLPGGHFRWFMSKRLDGSAGDP